VNGLENCIHDEEQKSLLQRVWLQQIHQEYCDICYGYGVEMRLPVFEISESVKTLGAWHSATRTLQLSRHLISNYPWSTTLQVLKHEMAHQLCSEVFCGGEKFHGDAFHKACDILGVIPAFRYSANISCETAGEVTSGASFTVAGRGFVNKVEKLLALAQSANEHEATLAMQKANELIERHNIVSLEQGWEQNYVSVRIDKKRKRIERYQRHICMILMDFFFVRTVLAKMYDPVRNETFKVIELFGTVENVAIGEYCYYFLENRLAFLWSENKYQFNGYTRTEKNSYYLGLLKGFYEKLDSHRKNIEKDTGRQENNAMILQEDQKLTEFVGLTFPRLKKSRSKGAKVYRNTFQKGVKAGKSITLTKGVTVRSCSHGKLLQ
jgi:hypothetical protein